MTIVKVVVRMVPAVVLDMAAMPPFDDSLGHDHDHGHACKNRGNGDELADRAGHAHHPLVVAGDAGQAARFGSAGGYAARQ